MIVEIDKEKYSHVYFVESGELYCADEWQMLGVYQDVKDLINYDVKSWKPHWMQFIFGNYRIVNGEDKYGDCERVYLGVKSK
jgi:hypothetical protein